MIDKIIAFPVSEKFKNDISSIKWTHHFSHKTNRVYYIHTFVVLLCNAVKAELRVFYRQNGDTLEACLVCILVYDCRFDDSTCAG